MSTTQGLDALAALCGNAASAAAANKKNNNNSKDGDKAQGGGGETAAAPAPPSASAPVPSLNAFPAFFQQQGQPQQQFQQQYLHQQAAGLQQAAAARQALSSMPPQLLQAYLASQPNIGQALQAALAGGAAGGGQFTAPAPPPAAASLAAAFPGFAAAAEQQQQQSQLQMIAAQFLAAQQQAAAVGENNGQMKSNPQPQSNETSVASAPSSTKSVASSPRKKRSQGSGSAAAISGNGVAMPNDTSASRPSSKTMIAEWEDKKYAKRAANRLSAHMSRKRKKMFVEDLKEENLELRRKEMILRSIPDLIVVFDSSGSMSFVSQSASRFLNYTSSELENTSFWDRLTEDSVRLIKSAFMDALAVKRKPEDETTPLAEGEPISVRIIDKEDKNRKGLPFALKGVVHFAADSPECVCTLCPETPKSDMAHNNNSHQVSDESRC